LYHLDVLGPECEQGIFFALFFDELVVQHFYIGGFVTNADFRELSSLVVFLHTQVNHVGITLF
jgi:hypothetical protein